MGAGSRNPSSLSKGGTVIGRLNDRLEDFLSARHNSYRVKRPGDHGTRHQSPPSITLVNLAKPQAADLAKTG